jgi:hypothetical protein
MLALMALIEDQYRVGDVITIDPRSFRRSRRDYFKNSEVA